MGSQLVHSMPPMVPDAIAAVRKLQTECEKLPQVNINTQHALHAGMYARTVHIPAGVLITGVLIKIPTTLIFCGDALVYTNDGAVRWTGYFVMCGPENRKQAFMALSDTYLTMIFPTQATTVEEAEQEFTDEVDSLLTRKEC